MNNGSVNIPVSSTDRFSLSHLKRCLEFHKRASSIRSLEPGFIIGSFIPASKDDRK